MPDNDFHKELTRSGAEIPEEHKAPDFILPIPKQIGPYKIECLLEKGGMSILYLGVHPETKDPTTLKVLLPRLLSHPDLVQRFFNEAEIIAMTDHPNIVKLYGHGEWEGGLYIAMEFIQGISLRQTLLQTPISLKRALEIVIDIAYALCHLHTHGVIHRDLKPENILITESGDVKVIDFGISQLLTEKNSDDAHATQRLIGTPIYMSPEQRENPETVSYPSDIYSLGIITYELVLGKLSHGQIHLSLMPKGLQKILNKALQPKPQDRYQDIVDFITEISSYLNSSNLHKENQVGDQLSEILDNFRKTQNIMAPQKPPIWDEIEIGLASPKGFSTYGIYYDFFKFANGSYAIMMGESTAKGAEGVIYAALLRGMVQGLQKNIESPMELASSINRIMIQDKMDKVFAFSYLTLNPRKNQLKFLSCGYGNLWFLANNSNKPFKIGTNSIALGIDPEAEFTEVSSKWNPDDALILTSLIPTLSDKSTDPNLNAESITESFFENKSLPAQKIVDAILRKTKLHAHKTANDRTPTFICIKRSSHRTS